MRTIQTLVVISLFVFGSALTLAQTASPTPTLTLDGTLTPEAVGTEDLEPLGTAEIDPLVITDLIAPIRIALPEGWLVGQAVVPDDLPFSGTALQTSEGVGAFGLLPFTVYKGPVTGGTGYIILVWGFRNVTSVSPGKESGAQLFLRGDGIRLLNVIISDPDCNIGIDVDREFAVGEQVAIGAYWAAIECPALADGTPGLPDSRGWFAVTRQNDLNFAFYVYTEPIVALDGAAQTELQAIMDSVVFDFSLLPVPAPTETVTPSGTPTAIP
ncbi:MAG: hypothetical protein H7Y11_10085 [Armatimonadetes bacterium]|nr:hypothetical protein [Anaerolineae bacterium]